MFNGLPFLVLAGQAMRSGAFTVGDLALFVQYLGLILERYSFFTEAQHPQNLYYQTLS
mgnify:CR=1 FL=1